MDHPRGVEFVYGVIESIRPNRRAAGVSGVAQESVSDGGLTGDARARMKRIGCGPLARSERYAIIQHAARTPSHQLDAGLFAAVSFRLAAGRIRGIASTMPTVRA